VDRVLVTGAARGMVRLAREEAQRLGARAVGTEHLLLALTHDPPEPMARALRSVGIDADGLRAMLQPTIVDDGEPGAKGGFTRYAREVLEGSLREAVERGDGFISADHLLLSLLRNPGGGAARTLEALGVEPNAVFCALAARQ
jgi:ATP-dependent Clp protease ATP-binding subunit ClpC